jgi:hypothetical protein
MRFLILRGYIQESIKNRIVDELRHRRPGRVEDRLAPRRGLVEDGIAHAGPSLAGEDRAQQWRLAPANIDGEGARRQFQVGNP